GHRGPEHPLPTQGIEQDSAHDGTGAQADRLGRGEKAHGTAALSEGVDLIRVAMLLAPSRLPPMPCRVRKTMSDGRSVARPHSSDATVNSAKPSRYRSLRPNISQTRPNSGRHPA